MVACLLDTRLRLDLLGAEGFVGVGFSTKDVGYPGNLVDVFDKLFSGLDGFPEGNNDDVERDPFDEALDSASFRKSRPALDLDEGLVSFELEKLLDSVAAFRRRSSSVESFEA